MDVMWQSDSDCVPVEFQELLQNKSGKETKTFKHELLCLSTQHSTWCNIVGSVFFTFCLKQINWY